MTENEIKKARQKFLQARIDGRLNTQSEISIILKEVSPPGGMLPKDVTELSTFMADLVYADNIDGAKAVAGRYKLDIAY